MKKFWKKLAKGLEAVVAVIAAVATGAGRPR